MQNMSNRTVFEIIIVAWLLIAGYYNIHTVGGCRARDVLGHIQYAEILAKEKRFPKPYEGWESWQNPLYYFIVSKIAAPEISSEMTWEAMTYYGRFLSFIFGGMALCVMAWFLQLLNVKPYTQLLTVLFVAFTPKFVFIFSTFNNDGLATLCSIATIALSYKLYKGWSKKLAWVLLLVATASIYAKLTAVICIGMIFLICCQNLLKRRPPDLNQKRIMLILVISCVLFTPWMIFHNYKYTGRFIATNIEGARDRKFTFKDFKTLIGVLFRISELQENPPDYTHEFDEPWIYPAWGAVPPATKRYDTFTYTFIISVIDEFHYMSPSVKVIWAVLLVQLLAHLLGLQVVLKSGLTKLAGVGILLGHIGNIVTMMPSFIFTPVPNVDFRYIAWTWMLWAYLWSKVLEEKTTASFVLNRLLIIGILIKIYILATVSGCGSE